MRRFSLVAVILGVIAIAAHARDHGAEGPRCIPCSCGTAVCPPTEQGSGGGASFSLTEGNLNESLSPSNTTSSTGPTLSFKGRYATYNADSSRSQLDTTMGYGWTHTYNIFLFNQLG